MSKSLSWRLRLGLGFIGDEEEGVNPELGAGKSVLFGNDE